MGDVDRLTLLPDDLQSHILSFLETKEAAATALLSRAWRRISCFQTTLEITIGRIEVEEEEEEEEENVLNTFTNGLLLRSNEPNPLHKLVINCPEYEVTFPMETMIEVAVRDRQVQCLVVYADTRGAYFQMPAAVFTSIYLKQLIISNVQVIPPNQLGPVFPSLKTLKVDISPYCPKSLTLFYSRCPVLEELSLVGNVVEHPIPLDKREFQVHSKSVRRLQIKIVTHNDLGEMGGHENKGLFGDYSLYKFDIDAPKLEILDIDEDILASYCLRASSSTFEAKLQVGWQDVGYAIPNTSVVNDVFSLLRGITHVRSLTLCDRTLGVAGFLFHHMYRGAFTEYGGPHDWALYREEVPIFPFLKQLKICISHYYGWNFLIYLLDCTPAVEKLQIEMVIKENVAQGNRFFWNPPHSRPPWWMRSLKEVHIKGFHEGDDNLSKVIGYFNNISKTKQEFKIIINEGSEGI